MWCPALCSHTHPTSIAMPTSLKWSDENVEWLVHYFYGLLSNPVLCNKTYPSIVLQFCVELNQGSLDSVRKWRGPRGVWKSTVSEKPTGLSNKVRILMTSLHEKQFFFSLSFLLLSPSLSFHRSPALSSTPAPLTIWHPIWNRPPISISSHSPEVNRHYYWKMC